jgi:hypothetical protein
VSPWWREEITAQVAPAQALLVRRSRGPRRRELGCQTVTAGARAANGSPDIVAAVSQALASRPCRHASLRVTLRGGLVRYLVLPWIEKLSNRDALVYARQSFADLYGEPAQQWAISVNEAGYGRPRIAAAVDQQMIDALQALARDRSLHLSAVRPLLCVAIQDLELVDNKFTGWLAIVDTGHSCIARMSNGECLSVRAARFAEPAERHLLTQLEQDALCAGLDAAAGKLYVQATMPIDHTALHAHGWQATLLPARTL